MLRHRLGIAWSALVGITVAGLTAAGSTPVSATADPDRPVEGRVAAGGRADYGQGRVPVEAEPARAVGVGHEFSVALRRDGRLVAWGVNDGATDVPVGLGRVRRIDVSETTVAAVGMDGRLSVWGNSLGGSGDTNPAVLVPDGLRDVVDVATWGAHTIALRRDGTVAEWGQFMACELWLGGCFSPADPPQGLAGVVDVAASEASSVAALRDGSVRVWGPNAETTMKPPGWLTDVVEVAVLSWWEGVGTDPETSDSILHEYGLALRRNGSLVSWGEVPGGIPDVVHGVDRFFARGGSLVVLDRRGRMSGPSADQWPPADPRNPYVAVALSGHSFALRRDGSIVVRGSSDLAGEDRLPVDPGRHVVDVAGGFGFSLALKRDGSVQHWGGQWGRPPADLPRDLRDLDAAWSHVLALRANGTVIGWDSSSWGAIPVPPGLTDVRSIAVGHGHALALRRDGTVVGWGPTCDPDGACAALPGGARVPAGLSGVRAIAAGVEQSLALRTDGTVVAWADDPYGRGDADVPDGLRDVVAIAAGSSYSLAVRTNGSVVCWGVACWQVPVEKLTGVVQISAENGTGLALRRDGSLVTWGMLGFEDALHVRGITKIEAGDGHGLVIVRP